MEKGNEKRVGLADIFWSYFKVGLTAFGFAILQKLKDLVKRKNWVSDRELNEGLALVQLYPGPIMVNLNTYIGYRLRGIPGALASTVAFITPTTLLMLILSYIYFSFGKMPWVRPVFTGLEALVVGVLINVMLDFGKRAIKGKVEAVISLAAFAFLVGKLNIVLLVLFALLVGAVLIRPKGSDTTTPAKPATSGSVTTSESVKSWKNWLGIGLALLVVLLGVFFSIRLSECPSSDIGKSALSFFKIGSIAFGNGLTILPLIQADVVENFQWLSLKQFADGIALSQITPGPFLVISTFIGFKLGGPLAALLTTFAMFSPSFILTLIFTELFTHVRNLDVVKGALAGVLSAFMGLLSAMLLQLGAIISASPVALVFSAAAFVSVRFFKLDILWIFGGGLLLWILLYSVGIPIG